MMSLPVEERKGLIGPVSYPRGWNSFNCSASSPVSSCWYLSVLKIHTGARPIPVLAVSYGASPSAASLLCLSCSPFAATLGLSCFNAAGYIACNSLLA